MRFCFPPLFIQFFIPFFNIFNDSLCQREAKDLHAVLPDPLQLHPTAVPLLDILAKAIEDLFQGYLSI